MADIEYVTPAVGDLGTQLFWYNPASGKLKFEYGLPVKAGADFGGDQESFDAADSDLNYIPKVGGRRSIDDVSYTANYNKERYARALDITNPVVPQTYMEVFNDGSAMIFTGTCADPSVNSGDVREIGFNIVPSFKTWVDNIYDIGADSLDNLNSAWYETAGTKKVIKLDKSTIPTARQEYFSYANAPA